MAIQEIHLSFKAAGTKAEVLYGQMCAQWCLDKTQKIYFKKWIDQIFQNDLEVNLPILQSRTGEEVTANPPGFIIRKVSTSKGIQEELKDVFFSNANQFDYLEKMKKLSN